MPDPLPHGFLPWKTVDALLAEGTDAFRLAALPASWLDWWAGHAVITAPEKHAANTLLSALEKWEAATGLRAASVWFCPRPSLAGIRPKPQPLRPPPQPPHLQPPPPPPLTNPDFTNQNLTALHLEDFLTISEAGLRYAAKPLDAGAPGFFPDQRLNRARLRSHIATLAGAAAEHGLPAPSILNLFAHTCSFSVTAAAAGARTLSVDISPRYLRWGKLNFRLNSLEGPGHRFWAEDARHAVQRLHRRGEQFDAIILDPPTFGHGRKGQPFSWNRDAAPLLAACGRLLKPGGCLLFSGNTQGLTWEQLETRARHALPGYPIGRATPPPDFTSSPCALSLWLRRPEAPPPAR